MLTIIILIFSACGFVLVGLKNKIIIIIINRFV